MANWAPYLRDGKVVALAVEGSKRSPIVPDVPTLVEQGYTIDLTRAYFGIVAPAGTPKPIVKKLRDEMAKIILEPAFRDKHLTARGHEAVVDTPEEFAQFLKKDRAISARIVKDSGVAPR
jgi:tripartite-type tricarboxylate transporter receptor subunit TctC